MTKKERKEKKDQKINSTNKAMEPVEIESKRTNVGSNIKTYNRQKLGFPAKRVVKNYSHQMLF